MSCNCIPKLREALQKEHGTEINFQLETFMQDGQIKPWFPPLYYSYKEKGKKKISTVVFLYCPFCGEKQP
jgi:hypothetical protein